MPAPPPADPSPDFRSTGLPCEDHPSTVRTQPAATLLTQDPLAGIGTDKAHDSGRDKERDEKREKASTQQDRRRPGTLTLSLQ